MVKLLQNPKTKELAVFIDGEFKGIGKFTPNFYTFQRSSGTWGNVEDMAAVINITDDQDERLKAGTYIKK